MSARERENPHKPTKPRPALTAPPPVRPQARTPISHRPVPHLPSPVLSSRPSFRPTTGGSGGFLQRRAACRTGFPPCLALAARLSPPTMPSEKRTAFWGFFDDDQGGGSPAAPGMEEEFDDPYSAAGSCALASSPPSSPAPAGGGIVMVPVPGCVKESRSASEANNGRSRSGIDHLQGCDFGGGAEDEDEVAPELGHNHRKRKRGPYGRHTPPQIQELQAFFDRCPHPDDRQRVALGNRLRLRPAQVKFWFQNRRTQTKRESVVSENEQLRQENDKLRADNLYLRQAMSHLACGGSVPAMLGEEPCPEGEENLRVQNAVLRNELTRFSALVSAVLGSSISFAAPQPVPGSPADRIASVPPSTAVGSSTIPEFTDSPSGTTMLAKAGIDRSVLLELATTAMDELVKMAQVDEPLWIPCVPLPGSLANETLNYEEYLKNFSHPSMGEKPVGFVSEASRESGIVVSDSSAALVEVLLDERRWSGLFSCVIAESSIAEEISTGVEGSRDGALLLMHAKLHVLSPLVPVREVFFLRFCKQLGEGACAIVDVSIDGLVMEQGLAVASTTANMKCRRLPSGCVVQDTPNGFCKVTWVEHTEYDESSVHQLYRPLLRSGLAFGAGRWLATLQRRYDCLDLLTPYVAGLKQELPDVAAEGTRSLLTLAERMMKNFSAGVSASSAEWSKLDGFAENIGGDVRVMARKNVDEPGVPVGVVLCAATSVWMLVTPRRLFDYLCDQGKRAEWDILSKGGPMLEVTKIVKGRQSGSAISLLKADAPNAHLDSSIMILQETCTDASGSMVVYAPVDILEMRHVIGEGADPASVTLLPSGFVVLPGGPSGDDSHRTCGSLLTLAFQILGSSHPAGKLTVESVRTVDRLISCTVNKIKTALRCV